MKRKAYVTIISVLLMLAVSGFTFGSVKLRDVKLLIDLDRALKTPVAISLDTDKDKDPDPKENTTEYNTDAEEDITASYTVNIRHTRINCAGNVFYTDEELISYLRDKCKEGDSITLMDDYAEAHTFRSVNAALETLCGEKGCKLVVR